MMKRQKKGNHRKELDYSALNKTLLKCEACGEFHPEDETEVVYIRVVLGKNCKLDQKKLLDTHRAESRPSAAPTPQPMSPGEPIDLTPEQIRERARLRKSIVPPGLLSAMTEPPELRRIV